MLYFWGRCDHCRQHGEGTNQICMGMIAAGVRQDLQLLPIQIPFRNKRILNLKDPPGNFNDLPLDLCKIRRTSHGLVDEIDRLQPFQM